MYADFKHRYVILNPKKMYAAGADLKAGAKAILEEHESLNDRWRLGHTKVHTTTFGFPQKRLLI